MLCDLYGIKYEIPKRFDVLTLGQSTQSGSGGVDMVIQAGIQGALSMI